MVKYDPSGEERLTVGGLLGPMKTRTFIGTEGDEALDALKKISERVAGESMDAATCGEFKELLNEAARAFTAPEFARQPKRKKERDRIAGYEAQARNLAKGITEYVDVELQHQIDLTPLLLAKGVTEYVDVELQHPIDVTPLLEIADQLHKWHASFELHCGRPTIDPRFTMLVIWLDEAWKLGARRNAGISNSGPFVEFVEGVVDFLKPESSRKHPLNLGNRIRSALRLIKKTGST